MICDHSLQLVSCSTRCCHPHTPSFHKIIFTLASAQPLNVCACHMSRIVPHQVYTDRHFSPKRKECWQPMLMQVLLIDGCYGAGIYSMGKKARLLYCFVSTPQTAISIPFLAGISFCFILFRAILFRFHENTRLPCARQPL